MESAFRPDENVDASGLAGNFFRQASHVRKIPARKDRADFVRPGPPQIDGERCLSASEPGAATMSEVFLGQAFVLSCTHVFR